MKLFKRLMTALLAGVLAVGMLAGCSGSNAPQVPTVPTDPDALAIFNDLAKAINELHFDATLNYNEELSEVAADYAKAQAITNYTAKQNAQNAALAKLGTLSTLPNAAYITVSAGSYKEPTAESYKGYANTLKNALATPYNANYVGVAVVEVDGKKYSCVLFVRA